MLGEESRKEGSVDKNQIRLRNVNVSYTDFTGTIFESLQNKNVPSINSVVEDKESEKDLRLVIVSFKIPLRYKKILEKRAEAQGKSLSDVIRSALDRYLGNDKMRPMKVGKLKIYS